MIDQDAPHDARRHREEVRAILPRDVLHVDQPQVRLVDQRRRLEAVARTLAGHAAAGDPVQLAVDERNQPLEGVLVALSPFQQQSGDLGGWLGDVVILRLSPPPQFSLLFSAS